MVVGNVVNFETVGVVFPVERVFQEPDDAVDDVFDRDGMGEPAGEDQFSRKAPLGEQPDILRAADDGGPQDDVADLAVASGEEAFRGDFGTGVGAHERLGPIFADDVPVRSDHGRGFVHEAVERRTVDADAASVAK